MNTKIAIITDYDSRHAEMAKKDRGIRAYETNERRRRPKAYNGGNIGRPRDALKEG
jgi:hypothetical protein